jgi:hypothetical protein
MNPDEIAEALRALLEALPEDPTTVDTAGLPQRRRTHLRLQIQTVLDRLQAFDLALDPVRHPPMMFDPANPDVVGKLIGDTLLEQGRTPLGRLTKFYGSGVYAIYYMGTFPAYMPASGTDTPLYVGKADPAVRDARTPVEQGSKLFDRLFNDHAKNIRKAVNLNIDNFDCRFLVVRSAWQNTAEDYLINIFKPIWNNEVGICYGFGKHGDSPTTRSNTRSPWDTLHPGRAWAHSEGNQPNPLTAEQITERILEHYHQNPPRPPRGQST